MIRTLVLILALSWSGSAFAKAYFMPIADMIEQADAIAVVKVVDLRPAKAEEEQVRYKDQVATIELKETLKGDLTGVGSVVIPSFFPCAIVDAEPGEYLIFLEDREGVLTSSNWHLSLRRITGDKVSWFADEKKDFADLPLEDVKAQIRK